MDLISMTAVAALAASSETGKPLVQELWDTSSPSGKWRYYDGMLYMLGLLHVSGNFKITSQTKIFSRIHTLSILRRFLAAPLFLSSLAFSRTSMYPQRRTTKSRHSEWREEFDRDFWLHENSKIQKSHYRPYSVFSSLVPQLIIRGRTREGGLILSVI